MSREIVQVAVKRYTITLTPTMAESRSLTAVPGSPFPARLYRRSQAVIPRDEGRPGVVLADTQLVCSFLDPSTDVRINDVLFSSAGVMLGKVIRVRSYTRDLQCDYELGPPTGPAV